MTSGDIFGAFNETFGASVAIETRGRRGLPLCRKIKRAFLTRDTSAGVVSGEERGCWRKSGCGRVAERPIVLNCRTGTLARGIFCRLVRMHVIRAASVLGALATAYLLFI